jgi:Tfp pilus assembly protein PilF
VLQHQGLLDQAIECYHRAIAIKPDHPDAYRNLGSALEEQGHLDQAIECYRRAHNNLGSVLQGQGHLDQAIENHRKAIALQPDHPNAHHNLGVTLQRQGHLDQAIECYRKAIAITPDDWHVHGNLGCTLAEQGHLDQAVECFRTVIAIAPDNPDGHHDLAFTLLAKGEMTEGWKKYEWRWQSSKMRPRGFIEPQWRGEAAEGKTLLVYAEQGFGDAIQFCRYAPLAAARGLRVIVEVREPLVRLFRSLPDVDEVVAYGKELPHFDLQCPMLSMPLALGTTLATIPSAASYLHADEAQVAAWRTRLAAMAKQGPRVGLVWAGSPSMKRDRQRSLPPDRLGSLLDLPGIHFFSLQKDGPKAPEGFSLTDLMDEMTDFADTAALIANLDLIISVDTAIAHLAAALGKPVWMLDRFNSDWRWFKGRFDSPWYPTLRLYRQPHPGDWDSVLADVARDLQCLDTCKRIPAMS